MSEVLIIKSEIEEDTDPTFYRLLVTADGTALQTGDFQASGVELRVFDLSGDTPDIAVFSQSSLDPVTTYNGYQLISNTLQTTGWTKGGSGYNFRHLVPATSIGMAGGRTYRFEYKFALNSASTTPGLGSGVMWALFEVGVVPVSTS